MATMFVESNQIHLYTNQGTKIILSTDPFFHGMTNKAHTDHEPKSWKDLKHNNMSMICTKPLRVKLTLTT